MRILVVCVVDFIQNLIALFIIFDSCLSILLQLIFCHINFKKIAWNKYSKFDSNISYFHCKKNKNTPLNPQNFFLNTATITNVQCVKLWPLTCYITTLVQKQNTLVNHVPQTFRKWITKFILCRLRVYRMLLQWWVNTNWWFFRRRKCFLYL